MIRFGPAGIPLSCKGRTLKDGIEDVHNLSLNALGIQMVRAGVYGRYPNEDEVGIRIRDVKDDFVVELERDGELMTDPETVIEEEDGLIYMPSGITGSFGELYKIGEIAKRLDVHVSLHTPYYMDLGSNNELTGSCIDSIRRAATIVNALDGEVVITSLGLYTGRLPEEDIDANIVENVENIMDWWNENNIRPKLGVEITGHQSVFGSLEQVLDLCDSVDGIVPVVNFPHYHSRTNGSLMESEDYLDLLQQVEPYCKDRIQMSFAGVEYSDGNERRLTPIKKGDLKFEPLAEALCELNPEATIISSSPLLEHDAMYMRIINERVLSKRVAKALKEKRKAAEVAAAAEE
ncbi:MAG: TIM barrel protein [Methanomassiliicoccaceae archaeon]|nr:TIM barrel protein [Methanomassiliicoccaceae archaeon]